MAILRNGYENISVSLINFTGNDLARQVVRFGGLGEFYEDTSHIPYSPEDPKAIKIVEEVISGKTFPKYALEGHSVAFQVNNISRICLAQLTRERGFFCSASGDVRPLKQDLIIPRAIYAREDWLERIKKINRDLEDLYIDMCEDGITYMESRYFMPHCETISLCYTAPVTNWLRSCNSRTENNFADEINYIYRLMLNELKKAIAAEVTDPLSLKLWNWLLDMADKKTWYKRDHTYNNDFARFPTPEGYEFAENAHNDWRNSSWKIELERMLKEEPELLFPGEKEMIEAWMEKEANGEELPTTYVKEDPLTAATRIKTMYYYNKDEE